MEAFDQHGRKVDDLVAAVIVIYGAVENVDGHKMLSEWNAVAMGARSDTGTKGIVRRLAGPGQNNGRVSCKL